MSAPVATNVAEQTTQAAASVVVHAPRKRRAPWEPSSWYGKALVWLLSPILDPHDNYPSGPRCMAWAICVGALAGHELGSALASMLLGTMWGYSAWKANQAKQTLALSAQQNVSVSLAKSVTHQINETIQRVWKGRDAEKGIDPSKPEADPSEGAQ